MAYLLGKTTIAQPHSKSSSNLGFLEIVSVIYHPKYGAIISYWHSTIVLFICLIGCSDPLISIFNATPSDELYKAIRTIVIPLVLSTDMAQHFDFVGGYGVLIYAIF